MGEYEPDDSRNVTGANRAPQDGPISRAPQQGHGQDPGMRSQAPQQAGGQTTGQTTGQTGPGQMGGQMGSGGGDPGQAMQFEADPGRASESNRQGRPAGGQMGGQQTGMEAHARAGSGENGGAMGGGDHPLAGQIRPHMEVIGADGAHVGTVDHVDGHRIKLTRRDSGAGYAGGAHTGHHHYLPLGLVAGIEGDTVRLSANGDVAWGMAEEEDGEGTGA